MFELSFTTDSAAFADDPRAEIAAILRRVAERVELGQIGGLCADVNGNTVGDWAMALADD